MSKHIKKTIESELKRIAIARILGNHKLADAMQVEFDEDMEELAQQDEIDNA